MFFLRDPLTEEVTGPHSPNQVRDLYSKGGYDLWELAKADSGPWTPLNRVKGLAPDVNGVSAKPESQDRLPPPVQATVRDDTVFCRVCGKRGSVDAVACLGCGVPPGVGDKYCNRCGVEVPHPQAIMCVKCGSSLIASPPASTGSITGRTKQAGGVSNPKVIDAAVQSVKGAHREYYRKVFTEIENGGGGFKAYWNWTSFFFGPFYFLYHGLFLKALILFVVGLFFFPASWAYAGVAFNYDLYLKKVKGKDLW